MKFFNFALLILPLALAAPISHAAPVSVPDAEMVGGFTDTLTLSLSIGDEYGHIGDYRNGTVTVTGPKRLNGKVFHATVSGPGLSFLPDLIIGGKNSAKFSFHLPSSRQLATYKANGSVGGENAASPNSDVRFDLLRPEARKKVYSKGIDITTKKEQFDYQDTWTDVSAWYVAGGAQVSSGFMYPWNYQYSGSGAIIYTIPKKSHYIGELSAYVIAQHTDVPISDGTPASFLSVPYNNLEVVYTPQK